MLKRLLRMILPWGVLRLIYRWHAHWYLRRLQVRLDSTRKTIVVLNHFYDQDIRALGLANREYNLVVVDAVTLFRGAKIYFDEEVRSLHAPYASADPAMVARYRDECRCILERLDRKVKVGLLVSASDLFYWVREFIAVARERGIRTVILDKEGVISPHDFVAEAERIRVNAPPVSDHLFVWSDRQREFWRQTGVDDSKITVIGQPRSDLLRCERRNDLDALFPSVQPLVSLFSYMDDAYVPAALIRSEHLTWGQMKTETHDEVARLAEKHPDFNFVIKTHPQQPDLELLRRNYARPNLAVIGGATTSNEILQRSELIIAFQTTAVLEAMSLNKRLIYTYWDPLAARLEDGLLPFHEAAGIAVARSLADFRAYCARFFSGDASLFVYDEPTLKRREAFVEQYFYRPDGHVCERFFQHVGRFVK